VLRTLRIPSAAESSQACWAVQPSVPESNSHWATGTSGSSWRGKGLIGGAAGAAAVAIRHASNGKLDMGDSLTGVMDLGDGLGRAVSAGKRSMESPSLSDTPESVSTAGNATAAPLRPRPATGYDGECWGAHPSTCSWLSVMPRRNFWFLVLVLVVCLACHLRASRSGQVLSYAMGQIERRFLEPVGERRLLEGALDGMMAELKDQYSVYLRPKVVAEFEQSLDQRFGGVGVEIILDPATKQLTVASPLFGAPAYEAGIRPRDRILRIDGRSTQGLSLEDAADLMKGKPGAAVLLTVQHEGETEPVEIRVVRAEV